jgi:hypothetical protein
VTKNKFQKVFPVYRSFPCVLFTGEYKTGRKPEKALHYAIPGFPAGSFLFGSFLFGSFLSGSFLF